MDGFFGDWGFNNLQNSRMLYAAIGFWLAMLMMKLIEDKNERAVILEFVLLSILLAIQVVK